MDATVKERDCEDLNEPPVLVCSFHPKQRPRLKTQTEKILRPAKILSGREIFSLFLVSESKQTKCSKMFFS